MTLNAGLKNGIVKDNERRVIRYFYVQGSIAVTESYIKKALYVHFLNRMQQCVTGHVVNHVKIDGSIYE